MLNIKNLLESYIKKNGINQSVLAKRLGVGHGMVSKWIRGYIYPSVKHYEAIKKLCAK